jgi:hypothetical protein
LHSTLSAEEYGALIFDGTIAEGSPRRYGEIGKLEYVNSLSESQVEISEENCERLQFVTVERISVTDVDIKEEEDLTSS